MFGPCVQPMLYPNIKTELNVLNQCLNIIVKWGFQQVKLAQLFENSIFFLTVDKTLLIAIIMSLLVIILRVMAFG